MADDQEKTEEPTPKKLSESRKKGEVPQSRDFATFVVFLGLCIVVYFTAGNLFRTLVTAFEASLQVDQNLIGTQAEFIGFTKDIIILLLKGIAPIFGGVFLFALFAYIGQFGFLFTTKRLVPNFGKINPMKGLKRIFSKDTLVELVKSLFKVSVLGVIMFLIMRSEMDNLLVVGRETIAGIFLYTMQLTMKLMLGVLAFLLALGFVDLLYQRWSFHQKQKMSVKEVKDEFKQQEGDPLVKARVRQIQREVARARMMDDVPGADVVVANPTHVAVALKYKRGQMTAPVVVAKGAGFIAIKIKEIAIKNGVPVLEKRSLARFLFRNVDIGEIVPESLYSAVAEVLAYVYRMKMKYKSFGSLPSELRGGEAPA
ncbi:MAG: flagellar biosynthesis protein FlhB [Bradymonadales bacterium]|nr:MAG: flagellar biosynthesis protein FlhB [Bradymonadales bacterium]